MGITSFFANRDRAEVTDFSPVLRVTENKLFIKFPGRDLGGFLAFLQGFTNDAWLASGALILVVPAFLYFIQLTLRYFNLTETDNWHYGWNLLVFLGGVAQQVTRGCFQVSFYIVERDYGPVNFLFCTVVKPLLLIIPFTCIVYMMYTGVYTGCIQG